MERKAFKSQISKIFTSIVDVSDVFGQLPSLRVLKKSYQKSSVGFCMTFILMVITSSYLISEIINMLQRSQPSMIASEQLIFDTQDFSLQNHNFTLAISIANNNFQSIKGLGKYYKLEIQQCNRERIQNSNTGNITINLNCSQIPFETCNISHFQTDLQRTYFQNFNFGSLQCINRKFLRETPPVLKGQLNSMEYRFLVIYLKKCQNTTEYQGCASDEEIHKQLQSASYNIYSSEYLLQLARSDEPLEQIITPYFVSFSSTTSKKIIQYQQIVQTITDDGLLFENNKVQANLKKGQFEPYSEIYNGEYLIQHWITIQSVQTNYFRSYIKIQTILAKIGGIWQVLFLIFSYLFKWLLQDIMLLQLSNKLFNFSDYQIQQQVLSNLQSDEYSGLTQIQSEKFPDNFFQSIKIIFGCNKQKKEKFLNAKKEIYKNLDIAQILRQLQRFEMFTKLFLNESQYQALSKLSKPRMLFNNKGQGQRQKQIQASILSSNNSKEISQKSSPRHLSFLFKELKASKVQGIENYLNNKLLLELQQQLSNFNLEMQTPKSQTCDNQVICFEEDIVVEARCQKLQ